MIEVKITGTNWSEIFDQMKIDTFAPVKGKGKLPIAESTPVKLPVTAKTEEPKKEEPKPAAPVEEVKPEEPKASEPVAEKTSAPAHDKATVRGMLNDLRKKLGRSALETLIKSYEVNTFADLPEDKYDDIYGKAEAMLQEAQ